MRFLGKKLLVLGTSVASVDIVNYARENGAYVIVTDYLPTEKSKAKQMADEAAMVSTTDIEAICRIALEKQVDGVFCGVSETNLVAVQAVCEKLRLPCYFNAKQWELCQKKNLFKALCREHGVPSPKECVIRNPSETLPEEMQFPVIIKPTDACSGAGISVCFHEEELREGLRRALEASESKTAMLEEYLQGTEITAVYTIIDGEISLSCVRDRFPSEEREHITAQFDLCLWPSKYYEIFVNTADEPLRALLKSVGIRNGCVFFQGIVDDSTVKIFECGLRMNGLADYYLISECNGIDYMKLMVSFALGCPIDKRVLAADNPNPQGFHAVFNMTAHEGIIKSVTGLQEAQNLPNVIHASFLHSPGQEIAERGSLAQSVFRAYISCETKDELIECIQKLQDCVHVTDTLGRDMLYRKFRVERLV